MNDFTKRPCAFIKDKVCDIIPSKPNFARKGMVYNSNVCITCLYAERGDEE